MAKTKFTKSEIKILQNVKCIVYVSELTVRFSKEILSNISDNASNINEVRDIFKKNNVPLEIIGNSRIRNIAKRYASSTSKLKTVKSSIKHNFTQSDKKKILKSNVVTKVGNTTVGYTAEFKQEVAQCINISDAKIKFEENGLSI